MSRVLCGGVAWLVLGLPTASLANDAEEQAAAIAEKLGGKVTRDEKRPGRPVVEVDFGTADVTAADLRALAPLKNLTRLHLFSRDVTDGVLAVLREINLLHTLGEATAANGERPTKPEDVTELSINSPITDAGLKELAGFKNLTSLNLGVTKVTVSRSLAKGMEADDHGAEQPVDDPGHGAGHDPGPGPDDDAAQ